VTEQRINAYEGLFLFPQAVAGELQFAVDHVTEILAKSNAEIISLSRWDERRLAYEINGNKRGIYFLVYFRANRTDLVSIERSCNLSETLLRSMMVRADQLTQQQMEAADGTTQIADEIKLRAEQAVAVREPAPVVESPDQKPADSKSEEKPAVTVETEVSPSDAATT
jgi:small subunit ribosomal protein S6